MSKELSPSLVKTTGKTREPRHARKNILVAAYDPISRRLLDLHFSKLGFNVTTASDGVEALNKMYMRLPDVVASDVVMPRLDGFRLAQYIRREPTFSSVSVVLMTSGTVIRPDDEAMARNMGANAIVEYSESGYDAVAAAVRSGLDDGPLPAAYDVKASDELRTRFIEEGLRDSRELLQAVNDGLDLAAARDLSRRWMSSAATFRLPQVSQTAYEIERTLDQIDPDGPALHALLAELVGLFSVLARIPERAVVPQAVAAFLAGKRFAAAGFDEAEGLHLSQTLEQVHSFVRILDSRPHLPERRSNVYDCVLLNAQDASDNSLRLAKADIPLIVVGSSCASVEALLSAHTEEHDFVLRPWSPSEVLFRCYSVTYRSTQARARNQTRAGASKARILVGDDDPTTLALIQMTLGNYKMDCETASSGGKIIEAAMQSRPDIVILDINMPELDGFEVLSALKRNEETRNIPVFVLTARQQETDILRGFSLGAEDYITKPFSPMELVARIKRTLRGPT